VIASSVLIFAACVSGGEDGRLGADTLVDGTKVPEAYLQGVLEDAPPEQQAKLADGGLTFAEYEGAVLDAAECIRSGGLQVIGPSLDGSGTYYEFQAVARNDSFAADQALIADCTQRHMNAVADVWSVQHLPSEDTLQEARVALESCLREAGVALPDEPTSADFASLASEGDPRYGRCSRAIQDTFGLPGFGG
jgi:hypothetical protein